MKDSLARQTWEIPTDSVPARIYWWWRRNWGEKQKKYEQKGWYQHETLCHFVWVFLLEAPIVWLLTAKWHWALRPMTIIGYLTASIWAVVEILGKGLNWKIAAYWSVIMLSYAGMGWLFEIIKTDEHDRPIPPHKRLGQYRWSPVTYAMAPILVPGLVLLIILLGVADIAMLPLLTLIWRYLLRPVLTLMWRILSPLGRLVSPLAKWLSSFATRRLGVNWTTLGIWVVFGLILWLTDVPWWYIPIAVYAAWLIIKPIASFTGLNVQLAEQAYKAEVWLMKKSRAHREKSRRSEKKQKWYSKPLTALAQILHVFWMWKLAADARICPYIHFTNNEEIP